MILKGIYFCLIANWHLFNFVEEDIDSRIYSLCKKYPFDWHVCYQKNLF